MKSLYDICRYMTFNKKAGGDTCFCNVADLAGHIYFRERAQQRGKENEPGKTEISPHL